MSCGAVPATPLQYERRHFEVPGDPCEKPSLRTSTSSYSSEVPTTHGMQYERRRLAVRRANPSRICHRRLSKSWWWCSFPLVVVFLPAGGGATASWSRALS